MVGRRILRVLLRPDVLFLVIALFIPLLDLILPRAFHLADLITPIFVYAILALGLNIVTGHTGLLHLGVAAFMAIGVYAYAILTCEIYPYRLGFWPAIVMVPFIGAVAGVVLGSPSIRLRGDYLAIVTLGFGEIVQDVLKNVDTITQGTQGINPLPYPSFFGYTFTPEHSLPFYYLYWGFLLGAVVFCRSLENSRVGRSWAAIREDELAAACAGIDPARTKLISFATGAGLCSLAGALWAALLSSSGEPGNYDFLVSVIALCMVIVGGGRGVLLGALLVVGLDSIVLSKLTLWIAQGSSETNTHVFMTPSNWKFMIFGMALIVMMRFRPMGIFPLRPIRLGAGAARSSLSDRPKPEESGST
jgi:branched-chain amino acid transport system permease protein